MRRVWHIFDGDATTRKRDQRARHYPEYHMLCAITTWTRRRSAGNGSQTLRLDHVQARPEPPLELGLLFPYWYASMDSGNTKKLAVLRGILLRAAPRWEPNPMSWTDSTSSLPRPSCIAAKSMISRQ